MTEYYDRQGNPMSVLEWSQKFADKDYQRLARTEVGDVVVSTVWLGLDHNLLGDQPHIFETMIFGGKYDQDCERYATEGAAVAGHDQMVAKAREEAE